MDMKRIVTMGLMGLAVVAAYAGHGKGLPAGENAQAEMARGADVSWCTEMEADGRRFYSREGTEMEMMALMRDIGMTAIRLRVWVNPKGYGYGPWCDKADVVGKARRAHAAGLDLMVDFHYSDTFCDPGTQGMPLDWRGCSLEQLKEAVAAHTKDVLQALKDEGIEPRWVQVGNETNSGMLDPMGRIDWDRSGPARFANYVAVSNAGYDAVKAVLPGALVIIHLGGTENADWFFGDFRSAGGKFDMIGLSHYPTESEWTSSAAAATHSNVNAAKWVRAAAGKYGVPVMICETGFDVSKPALASKVMNDLFARMGEIPECAGIFYWEPQVDGVWKPAWYDSLTWTDEQGNTHQGWGAYGKGAFTSSGRPTIALDAFSGKISEETGIYPSELKVYNKDGKAVLTTLPKTGEGIYAGQLCATESWMNFHVVDEEHNVWYGTDPADKSALSSADGHWNFWIDSDVVGVYDLEVNLVTMRWTHSFNTDATEGIRAVDAGAGLPVSWFDLNGRRLMAPARGVMLMKTGRGVSKVSTPTL